MRTPVGTPTGTEGMPLGGPVGITQAARLTWLEKILAALAGRGSDGTEMATRGHLREIQAEYSGQLKEVYTALESIKQDITDMRLSVVRIQ